MVATLRKRVRDAEDLLWQAQQAPEGERRWLMTVAWELLHDVVTDLGQQVTEQVPSCPPREGHYFKAVGKERLAHCELEVRA